MHRHTLTLVAVAVAAASSTALAQETPALKLVEHGSAVKFDYSGKKIAELAAMLPPMVITEGTSEIRNYFPPEQPESPDAYQGQDPLAGDAAPGPLAPAPVVNFPALNNFDNQDTIGGRIAPPDTNGDVGLDYYVEYINLIWAYYDKETGALAGGPFPGNAFWAGFGGVCESNNAGDPIVLFDHIANQWVFSQFTSPSNPNGTQCFAISEGSDPAGPYYRYAFTVTPGAFNDYPKIGLWSDGAGQSAYHYTMRLFNGESGIDAVAFERDAMLAGQPAQFVRFELNNFNPDGVMPAHLDGGPVAPTGSCGLYGVAENLPAQYQFWELCTDWNQPSNSTFTRLSNVSTNSFNNSLNSIPQQGGPNLDDLDFFTAYRFSVRNLQNGGLTGVLSHTVDLDTNQDIAGIRYAKLDLNDYDDISIIKTDTVDFGLNDGIDRWMSAATLDKVGNIAIGYSKSSSTLFPSTAYTGVENNGNIQSEQDCIVGTGAQTGVTRWGDYASFSVDPEDGCTMYAALEYVETTGNFNWDTGVCAFRFDSCVNGGGGDVDCDLNDSGGYSGIDALLFFFRCQRGALDFCDLNEDGDFGFGDVISYVRTCSGTDPDVEALRGLID